MLVQFSKTRVIQNEHRADPVLRTVYEAGKVYDLSEGSARHWIARGVADPAPVQVASDDEASAGTDDEVQIPEDWRDLHHSTRRALARDIVGHDVADTGEADEVIAAEIDRRADATDEA